MHVTHFYHLDDFSDQIFSHLVILFFNPTTEDNILFAKHVHVYVIKISFIFDQLAAEPDCFLPSLQQLPRAPCLSKFTQRITMALFLASSSFAGCD